MTGRRLRAMFSATNEPLPAIRRPATYQDVLDAPADMIAELANGALHLHPRPASRHSAACFGIAGSLDHPFRRGIGGPGGWHFAFEPELHLGPDVLVPDLAGWRRERMSAVPNDAYLTLAPDWVCEVVSPSTEHIDRGKKLRIYAREGVMPPGSSIRCSSRSRYWSSNLVTSSRSRNTAAM